MNDTAWLVLGTLSLVNIGLAAITNRRVQACGSTKCQETIKNQATKINAEGSIPSKSIRTTSGGERG